MKYGRYLWLLLWMCCPAWLCAQPKPELKFEVTAHDFGEIAEEGGLVTCSFPFTNTGNATLIITRAVATCGCTQPIFPNVPIGPGKSGEIKVSFNPKGRPGKFQKSVYVFANIDSARAVLTITGKVLREDKTPVKFANAMGPITLRAKHLSFFDVYTDSVKVRSIDFANSLRDSITLAFGNVPPHLTVKQIPERVAPGKSGVIEVTYDASRANDWGMHKDEFGIIFPGEESPDRKNVITVSADIRENFAHMTAAQRAKAPKIVMEETRLDFGKIKGDSPVEKTIKIRNEGKSTLQIRKINNDSNTVLAEVSKMTVPPGKAIDFKVSVFPSGAKSKILSHRIFLIVNDPVNPTFSIPVFAEFE
ncbi:MAG: DUF1573 domain-containing protein [Coprobacter sp.]|nr:DUF1573 domain-containing protein [Coprobacter sp.]